MSHITTAKIYLEMHPFIQNYIGSRIRITNLYIYQNQNKKGKIIPKHKCKNCNVESTKDCTVTPEFCRLSVIAVYSLKKCSYV